MSKHKGLLSILRKPGIWLWVFVCASNMLPGQVSVTTDNVFHRYSAGDTIKYLVSSESTASVHCIVRKDPLLPILLDTTIQVSTGQSAVVPFVPDEPGNFFCFATVDSMTESTTALFRGRELSELEAEPTDFDAYWADIRSRLDSVPIDSQITEDTSWLYQSPYSTTYKISLGSIDGRRVYGWMVVPKTTGKFTGLIKFPAFGNSDAAQPDLPMAERLGAIVISLNVHSVPVDSLLPANAQYVPDIGTSDTVFYRFVLAGAMRAVDYLYTRSDFDGSHIGVYGVSQGGGLAMMFAGIDDRVDAVAVSNPILCQHNGLKFGEPSGFPKYIRDHLKDTVEMDRILNAVKYYDVVFAAKRFAGPLLVTLSRRDEVTPAETTLVPLNHRMGKTIVLHNINGLHANNPPQYWDGKFDFFRRYFPVNYSWPPAQWQVNNIGYEANAGPDQTTSSLQAVLTGEVYDNNILNPPNIAVHWEVVSGPGTVTFSNPTNYVTTATFSQSGTYVLRFVGEESSLLATENKYYSIEDQVVLDVCPDNSCAPLGVEWKDFTVKKMDNKVMLQWSTATEINNDGFIVMKSDNGQDWYRIGFVKGAGTSTYAHEYAFVDEHPLQGINYYQLIQLDTDGKASPSVIRSVLFREAQKWEVSLFPNPASSYVRIEGLNRENLMLHVINEVGMTVFAGEIPSNGVLDVSQWANGRYFFRFSDGTISVYRSILLVN